MEPAFSFLIHSPKHTQRAGWKRSNLPPLLSFSFSYMFRRVSKTKENDNSANAQFIQLDKILKCRMLLNRTYDSNFLKCPQITIIWCNVICCFLKHAPDNVSHSRSTCTMQSTPYLLYLLICMIIVTASSRCTIACDEDDDDVPDSRSSEESTTPGYSIESIYAECNDSFVTTMEYLETLNKTGRFPEESDLTPLVRFC